MTTTAQTTQTPAPAANPKTAPRTATLEDIPALTQLWQDTGLYRPYNPPAWDVRFAIEATDATLFVWEDNSNNIIGSVMAGHDGHRGWVYYLAVAPSVQKSGLGRKLMDIGEGWLRDQGVWRMQLMVRSENSRTQDFYRHLGYRALDVTVMQKDIDTPPIERPEL
ncbi:GNAT family acetyltransferase [Thalassospira povalilytica]|uniref:GNAT family acetyltransferase n=1 Tax=Thalassospira povalilytica TaxID=732237 RepID=UPI001D18C248|nr:GNAT family acetyltransferase [Thalassospira povalilytica]MCC4242716.1 GNAT family acetyltransferase [Thalassospira povalilytica]